MKVQLPILVCGLSRCGTSLMMQILHNNGLHCAGKYPAFEDPRSERIGGNWMDGYDAVKRLDPFRWQIEWEKPCTVLWMQRDFRQQALSQKKWITQKATMSKSMLRKYIQHLKDDTADSLQLLKKLDGPVYKVCFEGLVERRIQPLVTVLGLDPVKTLEVIIRRDPACYPGFLEEVLVTKARGLPTTEPH